MFKTVCPNINHITQEVKIAIQEDVGSGDLTAELVPADAETNAVIIAKEDAILCGIPWVIEVFSQMNPNITVHALKNDGDHILVGETICQISGCARSILSGERTALNFLQMLSAVATKTSNFVKKITGLNSKIYDTRKTLPGLRYSLKYAVKIGGGNNHRLGLFDGVLIKENHIAAAGSINKVIEKTRHFHSSIPIQIEVESKDQLKEALSSGVKLILLDNFSIDDIRKSVILCKGKAMLEASGNIDLKNIRDVANTGVDRISIGALTKNVKAIDLSMRFI
ncbi:MAG: nicotinate-nucleotide diphosphorylase (carboxylating) [Proteobacteria bacterium]|nr:nicotinate-nucleotide diphosphorylase (carboxylating) [Pseudomonadota bacterium]